eukprot:TRINITY_DN15901_c0_g1_i10.p1 TRINITY_DN15901_c0_g1~~TRINITY_DN15901_c0_g1_i10.p1  ORF type:complete len:357 (-),score=68.73 TRINITY_DN15901_c0_g1_i10:164-1234(-)
MIDFGSSCFKNERIYTYIQSRFYRAPEVILGLPYTGAIDMWSLGCVLAELWTGAPLFPGETEAQQLALVMEVRGLPPKCVVELGSRKHAFFDQRNLPILVANKEGKIKLPGTKSIGEKLKTSDKDFVNFLEKCFEWNPGKRTTPEEALKHPWILKGLGPNLQVQYRRAHGFTEMRKEQLMSTWTSPENAADISTDSCAPKQKVQPSLLRAKDAAESPRKSLAIEPSKINKTCINEVSLKTASNSPLKKSTQRASMQKGTPRLTNTTKVIPTELTHKRINPLPEAMPGTNPSSKAKRQPIAFIPIRPQQSFFIRLGRKPQRAGGGNNEVSAKQRQRQGHVRESLNPPLAMLSHAGGS